MKGSSLLQPQSKILVGHFIKVMSYNKYNEIANDQGAVELLLSWTYYKRQSNNFK